MPSHNAHAEHTHKKAMDSNRRPWLFLVFYSSGNITVASVSINIE